jgi:predicted nuclease of predicted toxin-antitoxin system
LKLLFDQNLSFRLVGAFATEFPESQQVRQIGLETADDSAIWNYARTHVFAIVTKDEDFANRVALHGFPPQVVWLRTGNTSYRDVLAVLKRQTPAIQRFLSEQYAGCLELFP